MKTLYLLLILTLALGQTSRAQDTVRVNVLGKNMVTVIDNGAKTDVKIGDNTINVQQGKSDSVKIRVAEVMVSLHEIIKREVVLPVIEARAASDDLLELNHRINRAHQHDVTDIAGIHPG